MVFRDHGPTLRLGGGVISDPILVGLKALLLLTLYNFENIGGPVSLVPPAL